MHCRLQKKICLIGIIVVVIIVIIMSIAIPITQKLNVADSSEKKALAADVILTTTATSVVTHLTTVSSNMSATNSSNPG